MRKIILALVVSLCLFAADTPLDVSGSWVGLSEGRRIEMTLRQRGSAVTGNVLLPSKVGQATIASGKIQGNALSLVLLVQGSDGLKKYVDYDGHVEGKTLKFINPNHFTVTKQ